MKRLKKPDLTHSDCLSIPVKCLRADKEILSTSPDSVKCSLDGGLKCNVSETCETLVITRAWQLFQL